MTRDQFKQLEDNLWRAADNLRANSELAASDYSSPVLGLIFLRFSDLKYARFQKQIEQEFEDLKGSRIAEALSQIAVRRCGFYLPPHARYEHLLALPENEDIADAIKEAMKAIEEFKPELAGALPKDDYAKLDGRTIRLLLGNFANIPADAGGDVLGQIYEYFLGKFALSEGQGGGEFFTPRSVVRLMVEMIEPHGGTIFDPACGSGGMFVQSGYFIEAHQPHDDESPRDFYVYGQEKKAATVNLARMNLAVNGLRGDIKQGITYYDDHFGSVGKFDYVLANPPFNVDEVRLADVENDARFNVFGVPRNKGAAKETVPNANYLWINLFATSLKPTGRAALVMANSASDARHSEADIRQKLIKENLISAMLSLPSNLFYTVTLPATLWFFDRAALVMANSASDARHSEADIRQKLIKENLISAMLSLPSNLFYTVTLPATLWFFDRAKTDERILFIDARNIFTPVDRAHREFSDEQIQNIAVINHLVKGRREKFLALVENYFALGAKRLAQHKPLIETVSARLSEALDDQDGKDALAALVAAWEALPDLQARYEEYGARHFSERDADEQNAAQHELRSHFEPFFRALHDDLKRLDKQIREHEKRAVEKAREDGKRPAFDRKTKELKSALGELHEEVKDAETPFRHIAWLQERFPAARYEDVTGLCKLASPDEVKEQDFSLNPGRYVGVVIEEDGKTEEEWIEEVLGLNDELEVLNQSALKLESAISANVKILVGEA